MKRVFADTQFWVAIAHPDDPWADSAKAAHAKLGDDTCMVTTEEVLTEFLTSLCGTEYLRGVAVRMFHALQADSHIEMLPQSHDSFTRGVALYAQRLDKAYSLVDCISMETMRDCQLQDVLTHDHHFTHEGFRVLMI